MAGVLAGDIGGTKTRLALVEVSGTQATITNEREFVSADYASFDELLAEFMNDAGTVHSAAFGVAGPVHNDTVQTTNLPWRISADALRTRFGFANCHLLNDLEATAYGLPALQADDVFTLHAGAPYAQGNRAIIAAGTGLGEAGLFWDGHTHRPFATEGGHASFAPRDALEFEFAQTLRERFGHVSWERVVSGMGIPDLYDFLLARQGGHSPDWLLDAMQKQGKSAAISHAALAERDALCTETMHRFVSLYGAEAGNLALKTMSSGGLYVGGGIAPKIMPLLESGAFLGAFFDKGRMRPLLEAMPVRIILNDRAALYGPALFAAQRQV
ncbi:MAG: glucokinase [Gammaproteobacteria bacterium]|nr:glucokinase [Gammaproteobacteria bacterium]MBU1624803.1 glucokinase [Gammaproteobacteria bacterium]MBU1982647.1 glucokinase [Gammaproteobacteria bacterium]